MSIRQVTNEEYDNIFNQLHRQQVEQARLEQVRYRQLEALKSIIMKILDEAYSTSERG